MDKCVVRCIYFTSMHVYAWFDATHVFAFANKCHTSVTPCAIKVVGDFYHVTSYLRMSTDFSAWIVCCESEPGGACCDKNSYIAIEYWSMSTFDNNSVIIKHHQEVESLWLRRNALMNQ